MEMQSLHIYSEENITVLMFLFVQYSSILLFSNHFLCRQIACTLKCC